MNSWNYILHVAQVDPHTFFIYQIFTGVCGPKRVKNCSFENVWLEHGVLGASFCSALIWVRVALAKSSQLLLPSPCSVPDARPRLRDRGVESTCLTWRSSDCNGGGHLHGGKMVEAAISRARGWSQPGRVLRKSEQGPRGDCLHGDKEIKDKTICLSHIIIPEIFKRT